MHDLTWVCNTISGVIKVMLGLSIQKYISESEFQDVFKMTKEQFYAKPMWKQIQLKKQAGLF